MWAAGSDSWATPDPWDASGSDAWPAWAPLGGGPHSSLGHSPHAHAETHGVGGPALTLKMTEEFYKSFTRVIDEPDSGVADVVFILGDKRFGGLRSVLSLQCEVLQAMLQGDFRESIEGTEISLEQFAHAQGAFRSFLFVLHTGKVDVNNVVEAIDLYEILEYFGLTDLQESCATFVKDSPVKTSTAMQCVNFAMKSEDVMFQRKLAEFIKERASEVFDKPKEVANLMPTAVFCDLLKCNRMNVAEITLFRVILEVDTERQAELLPLVRLPLIPAAEIMKTVVPSGVFSEKQCLEAVAFQADPNSVELSGDYIQPRQWREKWWGGQLFSGGRSARGRGTSLGKGSRGQTLTYLGFPVTVASIWSD